ncbi:MAG: hypothetical protein MUO82_06475 [Candidatus Thermoplasmatota archaeon]|nr:hypothetical protein [Candidatus Thermoplasmatota archaeon]
MKIKNRNEILNDIILDGKKHPRGWQAIFGQDNQRLTRDYYLMNPEIGIYYMKEYDKNPFIVKGIGSKIARKIDDEIETEIAKNEADFGIIQGDFQKIIKNIQKGIKPDKIFNEAIKGKKDLGLTIPVRGKASSSEERFKNLNQFLSNNRKKINLKIEEIANEDGLYQPYG